MSVCASCGFTAEASFRFCPECGAPVVGESREQRKTVTVLFCDLTGSTALGESTDPEALRALLARYFERMKAIVESHGGTVEKFIGDAVMAVFGVPVAHEDDALRACRAAVEMRDALPELGIRGRIGVNTGEVVTGTSERLATGDAVNVAARFEQAADPGEVLIGEATHALVHDVVVAEPVEPLTLKGKAEPVQAYRLVSVLDASERSHESPFVGRGLELEELAAAWLRSGVEQRCELVTIVADAGVGKTRLTAEVLNRLEARVVRGRCLSYGEGITYWPVVEVVKQLGSRPSDPAAAAAIASLLGESDVGTSAEEIAWAFRKLLEEQAPLICVFEDIHWGEETFLDLIEHVALLSAGSQVLLLCTARPELVERCHSWPVTVRLAPLNQMDVERLIPGSLSRELREKIAHAAGGNPLFLTEMVAMAQGTDGEVSVPPTLSALLTARLDQIDMAERRVLERGAVEGELFHRGAVQALAPEELQVTARLAGLVRGEFVRPERAQIPGDDGFRFRHILIRDAAYQALPKSARADLHQRFAEWLAVNGRELVEFDEIVGYHLEQAARYLDELGRPDPDLAGQAAERIAAAGRRAMWRVDWRAARSLLERAAALSERPDIHLVADLWLCLDHLSEPRRAARLMSEAAEQAEADGDISAAALARALGASSGLVAGECSPTEQKQLALAALPLLEAVEDHAGLAHVWDALSVGYIFRGHFEQAEHASEEVIRHARLAAGRQQTYTSSLAMSLTFGPRPALDALEKFETLTAEAPNRYRDMNRAVLLAMSGRVDEARTLSATTANYLRELGEGENVYVGWLTSIEEISGNHEVLAEQLRTNCDYLAEQGMTALLSTMAPRRGRALCELGRYDEADRLASQGRELGDPEDVATQTLWRQVAARVAAQRGDHDQAESLAREAVGITQTMQSPWVQGDALSDLGRVLEAAGRRDEAVAAYREALERYERKQITPLADRTRERLATLQAPK